MVHMSNVLGLILCKNLKKTRIEYGFSQKDFADRMGVSYQQIQKYENGKNRISAIRLYQLSEIYGLTMDSFFTLPAPLNYSDTK
jgi:transcriptional regulator with XRE-family HTH domain